MNWLLISTTRKVIRVNMSFDHQNEIVLEPIVLAPIKESDIAGYRVFRSPSNFTRFNVVAIDSSSEPLFVLMSDLELEEAMIAAEERNKTFPVREEV